MFNRRKKHIHIQKMVNYPFKLFVYRNTTRDYKVILLGCVFC